MLLLAPFLMAGQQKPAAKPLPAGQAAAKAEHIPDLPQLEAMIARLAPTEMRVETSSLSPGEREAVSTRNSVGARRAIIFSS